MHAILNFWKSINPRHAATLAAALLAAWALNDVLPWGVKWAIDSLLLGAWSLPELAYRAKAGKWPGMEQPAGYMPLLGWIAASCIWFLPDMRADYLPPSAAIDAALGIAAVILLAVILRGIAKKPVERT